MQEVQEVQEAVQEAVQEEVQVEVLAWEVEVQAVREEVQEEVQEEEQAYLSVPKRGTRTCSTTRKSRSHLRARSREIQGGRQAGPQRPRSRGDRGQIGARSAAHGPGSASVALCTQYGHLGLRGSSGAVGLRGSSTLRGKGLWRLRSLLLRGLRGSTLRGKCMWPAAQGLLLRSHGRSAHTWSLRRGSREARCGRDQRR